MYERDPRGEWHPLMTNYKPWELLDLTPPELDALVRSLPGASEQKTWAELTGTG